MWFRMFGHTHPRFSFQRIVASVDSALQKTITCVHFTADMFIIDDVAVAEATWHLRCWAKVDNVHITT